MAKWESLLCISYEFSLCFGLCKGLNKASGGHEARWKENRALRISFQKTPFVMDYKICHHRGSIMFTVTERSDSPEMDLMMPLAPSALWKKSLICSSVPLNVWDPPSTAQRYLWKKREHIPPPQSYDLGGHMVTTPLKCIPCSFRTAVQHQSDMSSCKHIQSLSKTTNDLSHDIVDLHGFSQGNNGLYII